MSTVQPAAFTREQAAEYVALSLSTWESLVRTGDAPKPRRLSKGRTAWLRRELDEWLEDRPVSDLPPGPTA